MNSSVENIQRLLCQKYKADFFGYDMHLKVGLVDNIQHQTPIHGLRHKPENGTTGWYIWSGKFSKKEGFFKPYCASHLQEWCPEVLKYLALPPGFRFLTDGDYEDIWFDSKLLNT